MATINNIIIILFFFLYNIISVNTYGAGFAYNDNFQIFADNQEQANKLLIYAEEYRESLSKDWMGRTILDGEGRTSISFVTSNETKGKTWKIDDPRLKMNHIYICGDFNDANHILKRELVHCVFNTNFPLVQNNTVVSQPIFPIWLEEGISLGYDIEQHKNIRDNKIEWMINTGNWPITTRIFNSYIINETDHETRAVVEQLVSYLLEIDSNKITLIKFGLDCNKIGIDNALKQHYNINNHLNLFNRFVGRLHEKYKK